MTRLDEPACGKRMTVMTSALPRTLTLLCLALLASAVQAEDQAAPSRVAASDGAAKQRRWFSFLRKRSVQRTTRNSPPVVRGVVSAGLLGGGLAVWLLLYLVRFRIRRASGSSRKMQEHESAALLGVLFGFPAGMSIYDKMSPYSGDARVSDAS